MHELSAVTAIATRDLLKFLRDRSRVILAFLLPFLLMVLLGSTVQLNLGKAAGFNFLAFTFTGVLGMTIFQSSVQGIASLLDDRQNDFAQEIFVAPISRYAIVWPIVCVPLSKAFRQAGLPSGAIVPRWPRRRRTGRNGWHFGRSR